MTYIAMAHICTFGSYDHSGFALTGQQLGCCWAFLVMKYIVMAHTITAHMVTVHIVTVHMVTANVVMAYEGTACRGYRPYIYGIYS